jgi:signal peptidase II
MVNPTAPRYERFYLPVLGAYTVVLLDQGTKAIASNPVTGGDLLSRNPGVAFGMSAGPSAAVAALSIGALVFLLTVIGRSVVRIGVPLVMPALFAAGLIGNGLDRIRFGSVRDFIYAGNVVFNVADMAIVAGVLGTTVALAVRLHQLRGNGERLRFDVRRLRAEVIAQ